MSTILDLPEVHARVVRWSVEDYEQLAEQGVFPRRAELIRGLVIEKMPKSPLHCELSKELYDLILKALPPGFLVRQEAPLRLADSEPEPDVSIVTGVKSDYRGRHPATAELVIEVAVSSAVLDRANAALYAEAGVREYWIVLGLEKQVEIHRSPVNGLYLEHRIAGAEETIECLGVLGVSVPLRELFA